MRPDGPALPVNDSAGASRASLFTGSAASGLHVMDSSDTTRIGVSQFSPGRSGFALHGPASSGAVVLYLKENGSLRFFDASGTVTNQVLSAPAVGTPRRP